MQYSLEVRLECPNVENEIGILDFFADVLERIGTSVGTAVQVVPLIAC